MSIMNRDRTGTACYRKQSPQGVTTGRLNSVIDRDACDLGLSVELRRIELLTSSMPYTS